jgi:hypothetical protein
MRNQSLIQKYKDLYAELRKFANDDEIFPKLNDSQFEEFVSEKDWMGVPSFAITKKEMTNSDNAHIGIGLEGNKVWLSLWFNGKKAVERFVNILKIVSENERKEFIEFIKNLGNKYKIGVRYTEKFYAASAEWETVAEVRCGNLTEETILELLNKIKQTKERRDSRQKMLQGTPNIATMAISVAEIEVDREDKETLEDAVVKLADLTRIVHHIKSSTEVRRLTKSSIKILQRDINYLEGREKELIFLKSLGKASDSEIESVKKEREESLRKLKNFESERLKS